MYFGKNYTIFRLEYAYKEKSDHESKELFHGFSFFILIKVKSWWVEK